MDARARGVLFDVDGTLIDSSYFHALAWWEAFRQFEHKVPMSAIHRAVGMGGDKLVAHLLGDGRDKSEDAELKATHGAVFGTYWPSLVAFDGARDLLRKCAEAGLAVVLASSARERELRVLRRALDADDAITAATSSSDAEESKPAPDILVAALEAGGLRAEDVVFVGDAVWDVYAASKLGIPTIAVTCGGTSEGELREAGAAEVYAGPDKVLEAFSTSALGRVGA
ncbi:HAD family hydrolase [Sinomonas terrae]|uniref:HAD family hydrolase n=1 Tax=Sinomonas terrae TaxID=2908838 RepID=A0ABS9U4Q1_9MICC|nr:HAD family hydrolase [Sinomonas terrae]MCH6471664.1 HAD family hydrolase [Sinomonas terrae]